MAISAVMASSLLVSAQSAATIENNYARLMQLQANAVAANECLNESFGHDAIGNITFPDDLLVPELRRTNLCSPLLIPLLKTRKNTSDGQVIMRTTSCLKRRVLI